MKFADTLIHFPIITQFQNPTKRLQASIVWVLAWTGVGVILFSGLSYLAIPFSWFFFNTQLAVLSICLITLLLVKQKRLEIASNLYTYAIWGLLIFLSFLRPGLNSMVYIACLVTTPLLAGLIINTRTSLIITITNLALGGYLAWLETSPGFTPIPYIPYGRWFAYVAIFSVMPVMVLVSHLFFQQVINTVRAEAMTRKESELIEKQKVQLEQALAERTLNLQGALQKQEELAQELEEALLQAQELNSLRANIITTISHEFRTPLTVMNTSLDLLDRYREKLSEEKQLKHKQRIKESMYNLVNLLDDVSHVNSVMTYSIQPTYTSVEFLTFCQQYEHALFEKFEHNNRLVFRYDNATNLTIRADITLLIELGVVLISNALKFSDATQPVSIQLSQEQTFFVLKVVDKGIGFNVDEQNKLTRLLYRAPNAVNYPGLGIGLHVAEKLTHAMYGEISYESAGEAQGTTFWVRIPVAIA